MGERVLVAVRIRPLQEHERGEAIVWGAQAPTCLKFMPQGVPSAASATPHATYDRVFDTGDSSEAVYTHTTHGLVQSVLHGFHACVFAYGQTGAGKTYTMAALMQMAATDIFDHIQANPAREYLLRISAMEIYNEVVRDMLRPDGPGFSGATAPASSVRGEASSNLGPGLKVMEDEQGVTVVEGLCEEGIQSVMHLQQVLQDITARRHVRDTRMNQSSSRSHQIVRLIIESRPASLVSSLNSSRQSSSCGGDGAPGPASTTADNRLDTAVMMSTISFVDLAGSERLSQAAATTLGGEVESIEKERLRQKEAGNINRSLLTLGTVIRTLGNDPSARKHVPYRDSKLTRILQPCLSGNARMTIITTISPAASSADNTRAALHFANAAKKMVMSPQVNAIHDDQALMRRMQAEIEGLRKQLAETGLQVQAETGLRGALEAKEEEARRAGAEVASLQKRLQNLERLILKGGPSKTMRTRLSLDGSLDLASIPLWQHEPQGGVPSLPGSSGSYAEPVPTVRPRHPAASMARASWNPGTGFMAAFGQPSSAGSITEQQIVTPFAAAAAQPTLHRLSQQSMRQSNDGAVDSSRTAGKLKAGSAGGARAAGNRQWLLLDHFLPPHVRKAVSQGGAGAGAAPTTGNSTSNTAASSTILNGASKAPCPSCKPVPKLNLTKLAIQKLEAPSGADVEAARLALQAEMHCISSIAASTGELVGALAPGTHQHGGSLHTSPIIPDVHAKENGDAPSGLGADHPGARGVGGSGGGSSVDAAVHHLQQAIAALEAKAKAEEHDGQSTEQQAAERAALIDTLRGELARLVGLQEATARAAAAMEALQQRNTPLANGDPDPEEDMDDQDADPSFNAMPGWMVQVFLAGKEGGHHAHSTAYPRGTFPRKSVAEPAVPEQDADDQSDSTGSPCRDQDSKTTLRSAGKQAQTRHTTDNVGSEVTSKSGLAHRGHSDSGCKEDVRKSGVQSDALLQEEVGESKGPGEGHIPQPASVRSSADPAPDSCSRNRTQHADTAHNITPCSRDVRRSQQYLDASQERQHHRHSVPTPVPAASPMVPTGALRGSDPCPRGVESITSDGPATPSLASRSHSLTGQKWDSTQVRGVLKEQKREIKKWYRSELRRMQADLAAKNATDVSAVRALLDQYIEAKERLEIQKRLLVHQVITLELELEREASKQEELQDKVQQLTAERDQAKAEMRQAKAAARAAAVAAARAQSHAEMLADEANSQCAPTAPALSLFDNNDGWETQESPEKLMPGIINLWHALHVPLVYRSRFYLGFRSRELFYFELECRRLQWKHDQLMARDPTAIKEFQRAQRALDWEKKGLAAALRHACDEDARSALFNAWGISNNSKERKLQLINKIWHPATVAQTDGALHSSKLVVMLCGTDATEQLMELVFGWSPGEAAALPPAATPGIMTSIVTKLTTPRGPRRADLPPRPPTQPATAASSPTAIQAPDSARSARSILDDPSILHTSRQSSRGMLGLTPRRSSGLGSMIGSFILRQRSSVGQSSPKAAVSGEHNAVAASAVSALRDSSHSILSTAHVGARVAAHK